MLGDASETVAQAHQIWIGLRSTGCCFKFFSYDLFICVQRIDTNLKTGRMSLAQAKSAEFLNLSPNCSDRAPLHDGSSVLPLTSSHVSTSEKTTPWACQDNPGYPSIGFVDWDNPG